MVFEAEECWVVEFSLRCLGKWSNYVSELADEMEYADGNRPKITLPGRGRTVKSPEKLESRSRSRRRGW